MFRLNHLFVLTQNNLKLFNRLILVYSVNDGERHRSVLLYKKTVTVTIQTIFTQNLINEASS